MPIKILPFNPQRFSHGRTAKSISNREPANLPGTWSWVKHYDYMIYLCSCRLHNKGVYFKIGLRKMMFRRSCKDLHQAIRLEVDGKLVDMPPVEGIIILNILRSVSSPTRSSQPCTYRSTSLLCILVVVSPGFHFVFLVLAEGSWLGRACPE